MISFANRDFLCKVIGCLILGENELLVSRPPMHKTPCLSIHGLSASNGLRFSDGEQFFSASVFDINQADCEVQQIEFCACSTLTVVLVYHACISTATLIKVK